MSESEPTPTPAPEPCCGPDCGCNAPQPPSRGKNILLAAVILAAGAILVYKLAFSEPVSPAAANALFTAKEKKGGSPEKADADTGAFFADSLSSLASLNEKAMNQDAVMVWVPRESGAIPQAVLAIIQSAKTTIQKQGVKLGLYHLQTGSPDHKDMSGRTPLPAILVFRKGKGMSTVTGEINKEKLLQAYVASGSSGGCCPGGAGPACPVPQ